MAARKKGRGKRRRQGGLAGVAQALGLKPYAQTPVGLEHLGDVVAPYGASAGWYRAWREGREAGYLFRAEEAAHEGNLWIAYPMVLAAYAFRVGGSGLRRRTLFRRDRARRSA